MADETQHQARALATYRELLAKVDAKVAEITAKHASRMRCGLGCHGCCKPGLTVSDIERVALADHLAARPDLVLALRALAEADPHQGSRCSFLDASGGCAVYEARPLVCRSHGVPLAFAPLDPPDPTTPAETRDVCPLNFTDLDLTAVAATDLINLDRLNTILALLNAQLAGEGSGAEPRRNALTINGIL